MSTERINQLHEQASERYLNGDYRGALQAWRDVLGLDPANEQALGGLRLASQFVEPAASSFSGASQEVEQDLDQGLKVLDGLGVTTLIDPRMEDGSIDLAPRPSIADAPAAEEVLEGWEAPAASAAAPAEGPFGLEPVAPSAPAEGASLSAAGEELKRRVDELLNQAQSKADAGERDEALAILSRLSILDEDNADAAGLRSRIEAQGASDLDKVERAIIEGVAALEADRFDDAEQFFRDALAVAPGHREAQHYLEKVAQRRESGGEDLLAAAVGESAPAEDAVQRAIPVASEPRKPTPAPKPPRATAPPSDVSEPPPATGRPRFALPPTKVLILGAVVVAALVCAVIALPRFFGSAAPGSPAQSAPAPASRPARTAASRPAGKTAAGAPMNVRPVTPAERANGIAKGLSAGNALMASRDFGGAVLAFNEVLALDPGNTQAKAGILDAGERYKASKSERDALNTIKLAFRDGEFSSALRLAYRLPPTVSASYTEGVKVAGWYNLAVVALRSGDCRGALSQLDEALAIAPADADAKQLREFASRYAEAVKDRSFLDRVEALAFRPLPSS